MKQIELAEALGIAQSAISAIEQGKGKDGPSFRTIRDIATVLDAKVVLMSSHRPSALECKVVSESPGKLIFEEGFEDAFHCWALVRTLMQETAFTKVQSAVQTVLSNLPTDYPADDQAICGLWRMEPNSRAQMTASTEMLVIATSPAGAVRSRHIQHLAGGYYAMGKGEIDVTNESPTPIGILTVPLTSGFAMQSRRLPHHVDH